MTHADAHAVPSGHGADHDAPDGDEPLGPVDVQARLAGIVGVAIGLVMTLCFMLAVQGSVAY